MSGKHIEDDERSISSGSDAGNSVDEDTKDPGLTDPEVVTKYKLASEMANRKFSSNTLSLSLSPFLAPTVYQIRHSASY